MQRYLGIDAHSRSSTVYVMSAAGKKVRQDVVETNGQALIGHLAQIPGQLHVCLEEGEWSAWLHEILEPHVAEIVVLKVRLRCPRSLSPASPGTSGRLLRNAVRNGG